MASEATAFLQFENVPTKQELAQKIAAMNLDGTSEVRLRIGMPVSRKKLKRLRHHLIKQLGKRGHHFSHKCTVVPSMDEPIHPLIVPFDGVPSDEEILKRLEGLDLNVDYGGLELITPKATPIENIRVKRCVERFLQSKGKMAIFCPDMDLSWEAPLPDDGFKAIQFELVDKEVPHEAGATIAEFGQMNLSLRMFHDTFQMITLVEGQVLELRFKWSITEDVCRRMVFIMRSLAVERGLQFDGVAQCGVSPTDSLIRAKFGGIQGTSH